MCLDDVPTAAAQHVVGCLSFAAGFRRPVYAVLQDIFDVVAEPGAEYVESSGGALDEIVWCSLLLPLCYTNLRAPLRKVISCSDASEKGG